MTRYRLRALLGSALVGSLLACSGDDGADMQPPTAGAAGVAAAAGAAAMPGCDAQREVFAVVCGTSICHEGTINGLDLLSPGVEARLLDVPAAGTSCGTSGLRYVDSQDPEQSLLLRKLSESPPCGSPMPLGSGPAGLTPAQRGCVDAFARELAAR